MLKKNLRLKTIEDFERVFRQGKPLFFGALACKIAKNDLGHIRLGFSFGKKHIESAVERNRLRRILSEAVFLALPELKMPGVDIVFFTVKKLKEKDPVPVASIVKSVVEYINQ